MTFGTTLVYMQARRVSEYWRIAWKWPSAHKTMFTGQCQHESVTKQPANQLTNPTQQRPS